MNDKKMRKSSVAVLSALGVLALIVVVLVGLGRIAVSRMTSADKTSVQAIDFSDKVTTNFDVKNFRSLTFIGTWKVDLKQGDQWQVELTYPRGMEQDLKVTSQGDELILDPGSRRRHSWNWNLWGGSSKDDSLRARIVMPKLEELTISGTSDMDLSGFNGDNLRVTISGAGNIEADAGHYMNLDLTMSGAGNVELRDMTFVNARVLLSGAGRVELGMDGGVLSGNLSGFGNIEYYGPVSDQRVNISGFGRVTRKN